MSESRKAVSGGSGECSGASYGGLGFVQIAYICGICLLTPHTSAICTKLLLCSLCEVLTALPVQAR